MSILVTGAAGFIGMHVARALLARGETVIGIDNLNDYYDPALKDARLATLASEPRFSFHRMDVEDRDAVRALFLDNPMLDQVVHLAAQAGVRHSLEDPYAYIRSNVLGQLVILEACRAQAGLRHLVYASSSSVYGGNESQPFSIDDRVDEPVSLYAATKRADELMASCYAHLFDIPATGLRFFTVYGPWGRPDMSPWLFTDAIFNDRPIKVFNQGRMRRDFTYIDDIVDGTIRALDRPPIRANGRRAHRLFNLGNNESEELMHFIGLIEKACGKTTKKIMLGMQPGDVEATYADITASTELLGYRPTTRLDAGIVKFVDWFRAYKGH
ncbi:MAG: NAD-dependent epimerase/dehydratase family protein [Rhizobiales bacterium]|nr:NAD-dependent epimerase/dehydratase family protein [Hyphomicrobiales bacterium]